MTSERFDRCFKILVGHEGGLSTVRDDPGNWTGGKIGAGKLAGTKFGISAASFPTLDIANLTIEQARDVYRARYWHPIRGDQLPPGLGLLVFDSAVNNGVGQAIRWLQGAAGVRMDGDLGPVTLAAAQRPGVDAAFHLRRAMAMTEMAGWPSFGKGWAIRLATLPFQAATLDQIEARSQSPAG
jgi:lysozyme family protein